MARKAMSTLVQDAINAFPDNTTGQISASDLRGWAVAIAETLTPGYGVMTLATPPVEQGFTTTPAIVTVYDTNNLQTEPFTVDNTTGVVTVTDVCIADMTFAASMQFTSSRSASFRFYQSGVALPYAIETEGDGSSDPAPVQLTGFIDVSPGDTLDVRCLMDGGSTTDIEFLECAFAVRALPRRDPPP